VIRVRHHGEIARLEVAREEMPRLLDPDVSDRITAALMALGFRYVAVDLRGYRLGSLNAGLSLKLVRNDTD
jgi:uncharacterized protein